MSLHALTWAWECPDLDPSSKLVLLCLADHADADGLSWPALERIAQRTGRDRRTVQRSIAKLEELGLVERVPASGVRSTRYLLPVQGRHHATPSGGTTPPLDTEPRGGTMPPPRWHHAASRGGTTPPESSEPSIEPSSSSRQAPTTTDDDRIGRVTYSVGALRARRHGARSPIGYARAVSTDVLRHDRGVIEHLIAELGHEMTDDEIAEHFEARPELWAPRPIGATA